MSRKAGRGFKTPKNYDPTRGKKQKARKSDGARKRFGGDESGAAGRGRGNGSEQDFGGRAGRNVASRVSRGRDFAENRKGRDDARAGAGNGRGASNAGRDRFADGRSNREWERDDRRARGYGRDGRGAANVRGDWEQNERRTQERGANRTNPWGEKARVHSFADDGGSRAERRAAKFGGFAERDERGGSDRGTRGGRFERGARNNDRFGQKGDDFSRKNARNDRAGRKVGRVRQSAQTADFDDYDTDPALSLRYQEGDNNSVAAKEIAGRAANAAVQGEGVSFVDLGIGKRLAHVLAEMGATSAFPIQAETIPPALAGRDVLGRARTGSGKTLAFGVPLVERLMQLKQQGLFANDPQPEKAHTRRDRQKVRGRNPKALILAPTRELALQIDRTVQPLARAAGLFTTQLVGGAPIARQQRALAQGVDIVIGTPGRIEDLIERHDLTLKEVHIAVLDEADHMCELGFVEPVQRLLRQIHHSAQKLMFSATLDGDVKTIVDEFMNDPVTHEIGGDEPHGDIEHHVLIVMREDKDEVLAQLAQSRTIIFSRTRAYAERIAEQLQDDGVRAVDLHGDLTQAKRERNLARFTKGAADVLVATDVAARGIHVDDIPLVVQADPPDEHKTYLHRSGRTGRAGRKGVVLTVIPRNRQKKMKRLLDAAGIEPQSFADFAPGDPIPGIDD